MKRYGERVRADGQRLAAVERCALARTLRYGISQRIVGSTERNAAGRGERVYREFLPFPVICFAVATGNRRRINAGTGKLDERACGDTVFRYRYHGVFAVFTRRRRRRSPVYHHSRRRCSVARYEHQIARARAYREIRYHGNGFAVHRRFYFCFDRGHVHRGAVSHAAFVGEIPAVSVHMAYRRGSHVTTVSHKRYRVCALIARLGTGKSVYQAVESYGFNAAADYGYGCGMHALAT